MTDSPGTPEGAGASQSEASASGAGDEQAERVAAVLRRELQAAGQAARESGTDPEEITADLTERLARLRRLNAAEASREREKAEASREREKKDREKEV
ncbi:MAG TPA: hypothetical protein VL738_07355 [Dactylosporangium sp.]|jgi:hypothetical protein|nr:hypothetical protein [Dactylosporangium sp.]